MTRKTEYPPQSRTGLLLELLLYDGPCTRYCTYGAEFTKVLICILFISLLPLSHCQQAGRLVFSLPKEVRGRAEAGRALRGGYKRFSFLEMSLAVFHLHPSTEERAESESSIVVPSV